MGSSAIRLAVIGGDGIGPEVVAEALKVLKAAAVTVDATTYDLGAQRWHRTGETLPDYWDFFYFSFTVGMTAQTSDVVITSRRMRRLVIVHGIVSFVFTTAVIALTVNLGAQLVG